MLKSTTICWLRDTSCWSPGWQHFSRPSRLPQGTPLPSSQASSRLKTAARFSASLPRSWRTYAASRSVSLFSPSSSSSSTDG